MSVELFHCQVIFPCVVNMYFVRKFLRLCKFPVPHQTCTSLELLYSAPGPLCRGSLFTPPGFQHSENCKSSSSCVHTSVTPFMSKTSGRCHHLPHRGASFTSLGFSHHRPGCLFVHSLSHCSSSASQHSTAPAGGPSYFVPALSPKARLPTSVKLSAQTWTLFVVTPPSLLLAYWYHSQCEWPSLTDASLSLLVLWCSDTMSSLNGLSHLPCHSMAAPDSLVVKWYRRVGRVRAIQSPLSCFMLRQLLLFAVSPLLSIS